MGRGNLCSRSGAPELGRLCAMEKAPKILFIVAAVFVLIGVIVLIAGIVTGGASTSLGFDVENADSGKVTCKDTGCGALGGFDVLILKSLSTADCTTAQSTTTVTAPDSTTVTCTNKCGSAIQSESYTTNDPALQEMCNFNPGGALNVAQVGDCTVAGSGQKIWVVNVGEEIGEAVGGIFAAMGIMVVAFILLGTGSILACVGCCCLCMGSKS